MREVNFNCLLASLIILWLAFSQLSQLSQAAEYIGVESPPPASAGKLNVPIDYAFRERPLQDRFLLTGLN